MLIFLLNFILVTVLDYTIPQYKSRLTDCYAETTVVETIWKTEVWWRAINQSQFSKLYSKSIIGMEGLPDTVSVPDITGTVYLLHRNLWDQVSCPSNLVTVNQTTSVDSLDHLTKEQLYDILGRKVNKPYPAGLYFSKKRKVVIIK